MEKYCKNCGAPIDDTSQFCGDCGSEIRHEQHMMKYCPNCGEKVTLDEIFCRNCGIRLKTPKKPTGFMEKYKIPVIILIAVAVIAVVAAGAISLISEPQMQEIKVNTIDFMIPQGFEHDSEMDIDENDDGIRYVSKFWQSDEDFIQIDVMYASSVDAGEIAQELGGKKQTMIGHEGYYNEFSDAYSFSFVEDNKLVTVYTSTYNLLEEIESH